MDESLLTPGITEKQSPWYIDFLKAWLYVFYYALRGLKFLLLDLWVLIFDYFSFNVDRAYKKLKKENVSTLSDDMYEKTKFQKGKKEKSYKYGKSALARYDQLKKDLERDLQMSGASRTREANIYKYTVKDKKGKIITDTMAGFSKLDINSFLVNEGYEVYDIRTSKAINFLYNNDSGLLGKKMSIKDLVFWLTQLSTYLKAGITLNEAVKILTIQMGRKRATQKVFRSIGYELNLGESFSNSLAKQGNFFPALLINMIKAAEAAGTLQETLEDMAHYYTEVNSTKKEMKSALLYPIIIGIFTICVVTFIIIYVVPQFTKIYAQQDIEIKGLTAIIVSLSNFLQKNLILVILIAVLIVIILYLSYAKVKAFRVFCQIGFMKIPVLKDVIIYKEINIFAKTFASLLRNNVFITDSMDILSKITTNEVYKAIMFKTINNIVNGEKISDAFKDHWAVPEVAYYMIVTGESTGQLSEMMQKVSDYYQESHKSVVNSLKSLIEPVMIIFLAIMVALIVIAVIVPMFQLYGEMI